MHLTKSDFALARRCATRLYYRKSGVRPAGAEDEYLRLLAEGGFMVEEMARQLHPGGRTVGFAGTPEAAAERTLRELEGGDCVLYEATFLAGRLLARVDVLVKRGGEVELIEVKSGSYPGAEQERRMAEGLPCVFRGKRRPHPIVAEWREYLEDVAFQTMVVRRALPGVAVRPFLMMPDTSRTTDVDGLWRWFPVEPAAEGGRPAARFSGDGARLRAQPLLAKVDAEAEVAELLEEVAAHAEVFAGSLVPEPRRLETALSLHCGDCDLHLAEEDGSRRLFAGCWGELGDVRPSLFDLYYVGQLGGKPRLADSLIASGRVSLFDLDEAQLVNAKGEVGANNARQLIQLRNTRLDRQWVSEELPRILDGYAYPLRFIDFETSALPVPYHAGMRPYETVAFQWSCHTVEAPGAEPVHRAWINDEDAFPNFAFARSLRDAVGEGGSVFMWANHERTTLRQVRGQLAARGEEDLELAEWMEALEGRLVDMNRLTLEHYFHPRMRGETSLKRVADAVWFASGTVRGAFPEYGADPAVSPYRALPPLEIAGQHVVVREGTGAIHAYQAMLYGAESRDLAAREALRRLLLQYCRLDTAAMVMVWMHWRGGRT